MNIPHKVLVLNNGGNPVQWAHWTDAVTYKAKGIVAWTLGEYEFDIHGGISRTTGERSIVTVPSILAVKNTFKVRSRVPPLNNRNLFRRDLHTCTYCLGTFQDAQLTRDHIIPTSRGGKDTWNNCITACFYCNNKKDNKTPEEARMPLRFIPYVPDRAEELILANRNILQDQMAFLLNFIPSSSRVKNYTY
jgi:hypothetical protein